MRKLICVFGACVIAFVVSQSRLGNAPAKAQIVDPKEEPRIMFDLDRFKSECAPFAVCYAVSNQSGLDKLKQAPKAVVICQPKSARVTPASQASRVCLYHFMSSAIRQTAGDNNEVFYFVVTREFLDDFVKTLSNFKFPAESRFEAEDGEHGACLFLSKNEVVDFHKTDPDNANSILELAFKLADVERVFAGH